VNWLSPGSAIILLLGFLAIVETAHLKYHDEQLGTPSEHCTPHHD
jgi:hypothetical protein